MLPLPPRVQPQAGYAALMLHSHLSCLLNVAENQTGSLQSSQIWGLFHAAGLADGIWSHRDNPQAKSFGCCRGSPVLVRRARFKLMIFKTMQEPGKGHQALWVSGGTSRLERSASCCLYYLISSIGCSLNRTLQRAHFFFSISLISSFWRAEKLVGCRNTRAPLMPCPAPKQLPGALPCPSPSELLVQPQSPTGLPHPILLFHLSWIFLPGTVCSASPCAGEMLPQTPSSSSGHAASLGAEQKRQG